MLMSLQTESFFKIVCTKTGNEVVDEFLNYALELIKQGLEPKIVEVELSTKISLYLLNRSIDEITLRALEIIKGEKDGECAPSFKFSDVKYLIEMFHKHFNYRHENKILYMNFIFF